MAVIRREDGVFPENDSVRSVRFHKIFISAQPLATHSHLGFESMKPQNSVLPTARAGGDGVSRSNGPTSNKILTVSLQSVCLGRAVVLYCGGERVFRSDAEGLSGLISEVLPQARRMVVDLGAVHSLDSGVLGELVLAQMWAEAAGYELRFSSPTEAIRQLFESANLESVVDMYSTVEEALDSMAICDALPS